MAPGNATIDYKRGIAFVNRVRVAEWKVSGGDGKVIIDESKLKNAEIDVDAEKIYDALNEVLQQ